MPSISWSSAISASAAASVCSSASSGTVWPATIASTLARFAARVGKVVNALPETRLGRHVAGQLVRCGTSPPPNYDEACAAESRADFVHKINIALKELKESRGWLRFIVKAHLLPEKKTQSLLDECEQLARILAQSILTAKGRPPRPLVSIPPDGPI